MAFRKKTIEMDGVSVVISPFSCAQADEFFTVQKEFFADEKNKALKGHEYTMAIRKALVTPFLLYGLNNALKDGGPDVVSPYTDERLQKEFDMVFLTRIEREIFEMSGILLTVPGEVKAP